MEIIYREAEVSDALGLIKHLATVGGETDNLSFSGETFRISEEKEAKFIERFKKSKTDVMLVAVYNNEIIGNAIIERNRIARYNHRAELSITVVKKYWSMGVGSVLMSMLIDFCKSTGVEIIYLEVRSDNERGISLYNKFGFEKIGVYENFFKIGKEYHNADLMVLNLKI